MNRILFYFLLIFSISINAQQSMNMNLLSVQSYSSDLNDIWGYSSDNGEYALVGLYDGISVVNITNPSSPIDLAFYPGPSSMWRDIKTYGDYLYCINETGGGLQILNLEQVIYGVSNPTYIENMSLDFTTAHNLYIDENGVLYVFGSNYSNGGAMMFDLVSSPENPIFLGNYSGSYFHDGMVRGDTLWGGAIYNGEFSVVDVSDKSNPVLLATQSTPSNFTHNCWISDDGNTLFTTDEVSGAYVTSYDVSNLNDIEELDRIQAWSSDTDVIPHNTHVDGDFLITSYYTDGVSVVDASNPSNLIEVGYYDTSTGYSGSGFNGAWGTYPFLPSGNILVSDIENGLYVLEHKYTNASFLEGYVTNSVNGAPISNVSIQIAGSNNPSFSQLNGFYETGVANSGTYDVFVTASGYLSQTISVTLSSEFTTQLNVDLTASGCMDPLACNFNPLALVDDGSCGELDECGDCGGNGPAPGYDCEGNCISGETLNIEMIDSYGDGWNGNTITINQISYGLTSGNNAQETFCFDSSISCFDVVCDGGTWQEEVSWVLSDQNGNELLTGGAPYSDVYCFSEQATCQTIDFSAGWTIFSTYLQPTDLAIDVLLSPLNISDNLVIVKDVNGTAYLPDWDFNGIGDFEFKEAYLVKTNSAQSIDFCGEQLLPEQHPIVLNEGWNMFAYLRLDPANTVLVMDGIVDYIVLVKDVMGNAYIPQFDFNGIGDLESGKGYLVKMTSAQTLNYLSNDQEY
tara:strand:+ start:2482 stop:4704 length:2223 start_codon:yes stop_codon:yes gene_type:complete